MKIIFSFSIFTFYLKMKAGNGYVDKKRQQYRLSKKKEK
ncbi:hypothetical protein HMPREF1110_1264 [Streptococcus mitis SK579]|nr:hypothetical protein HMPREF1110_1264 [Streptococcus mitis SK579]